MFYLFQKSEKLDINVLKRSTRSTDGQIRKLQKKNMTDFIQFDKTIWLAKGKAHILRLKRVKVVKFRNTLIRVS